MSPGGYLGTDTGAKVATLEVMDQRGSAKPQLGYWAEQWDPDGSLHPIYDSDPIDGEWVHVTPLPMLALARPPYALGGYRLPLLLPLACPLGPAFASPSLPRRAAGDSARWAASLLSGPLLPPVVSALPLLEPP